MTPPIKEFIYNTYSEKCEGHIQGHVLEQPLTMGDYHFFSLSTMINGHS